MTKVNLFKLLSVQIILLASCSPPAKTDEQNSFDKALTIHLNAIVNANLAALEPTVADSVTLIFPDGQRMNSKADFMQLHQDWFRETNWKWEPTFLNSHSGDSLGYALIQYQYSEKDTTGVVKFTNDNYLVLIFKNSNQGWQLIHDQNTRIPH